MGQFVRKICGSKVIGPLILLGLKVKIHSGYDGRNRIKVIEFSWLREFYSSAWF